MTFEGVTTWLIRAAFPNNHQPIGPDLQGLQGLDRQTDIRESGKHRGGGGSRTGQKNGPPQNGTALTSWPRRLLCGHWFMISALGSRQMRTTMEP